MLDFWHGRMNGFVVDVFWANGRLELASSSGVNATVSGLLTSRWDFMKFTITKDDPYSRYFILELARLTHRG